MRETAKAYIRYVVNPSIGGMIRCLTDAGFDAADAADFVGEYNRDLFPHPFRNPS